MQLKLSRHLGERMQQRGISQNAIGFALQNGHKEYRQGRVFYLILDRHIHNSREESFRGVVVVTSQDGWVITAWRDRQGLKKLKRKPQRR
jgi:hypothetical protein